MSEYHWASMHGKVGANCRWRPPAFMDYWAPVNGTIGATSHHLAAICTSGVHRCLGTNKWKSRVNLPPSGGKLHLLAFTDYWVTMGGKVGATCRLLVASSSPALPIIGHRGAKKSVQLAALQRQVAALAFTDYWAHEQNSRCNLPPSGGMLHLQILPSIGHR